MQQHDGADDQTPPQSHGADDPALLHTPADSAPADTTSAEPTSVHDAVAQDVAPSGATLTDATPTAAASTTAASTAAASTTAAPTGTAPTDATPSAAPRDATTADISAQAARRATSDTIRMRHDGTGWVRPADARSEESRVPDTTAMPVWAASAHPAHPAHTAHPAPPTSGHGPTTSVGSGSGDRPPRRVRRQATRAQRRRRMVTAAVAGGLALVALVGTGGYALGTSLATPASAAIDSRTLPSGGSAGQSALPYGYQLVPGQGGSSGYGYGSSSGGYGSGSTGSTSTAAVPATAQQTSGVVTIVSELPLQSAESAGTGIILSSDGLILTNNHVVEGSTKTEVTDESTGKSYAATVVGTDKTHDIALLQLQDASGLTTASLETSDPAAVGDAVTAIGNAEGTGDLVAASGTVTALDQSVTTQSEAGVDGETLDGMIQVDADIVSGDSGGPLLDSEGDVVGIDTAASSGSADITGFAIPISTALDIASQIEAGQETSTIQIGYPGFLGVQVQSAASSTGYGSGSSTGRSGRASASGTGTSGTGTSGTGTSTGGAVVAGVVDGTPAAEAGLTAGDVITAVNGTAVTGGDALTSIIGTMEPGESVSLTWTTTAGTSQSATVTLIAGPAV